MQEKTSGRGIKGQKSRSGVAIKSFEVNKCHYIEGYPKEVSIKIKSYQIAKINLEKIQLLINKNRINKSETLNIDL